MTAPTALSLLTDAEKAAVLDLLIAVDAGLARRCEEEARRSLAMVTIDHVGAAVAEDLLALDQDDLAAHAGRTRYGYVEPTEAAWSLLEHALEPWLDDLRRRAILGLDEAARKIGLGILHGLERIDTTTNDERLLSWAPDFAGEAADRVLRTLADLGVELTDSELSGVSVVRG